MTVTYTLDVSSSTFLGLHKLLLRWRGSIWKSIWPELLCWLSVYFTISAFYRYAMTKEQQLYASSRKHRRCTSCSGISKIS